MPDNKAEATAPPTRPPKASSRRVQRRWRNRVVRHATRYTEQPFNLKLFVKAKWEQFSTSMFFSPCLAIIGAIGLGLLMAYIDWTLIQQGIEPPIYLTTNVDSARAILSTIAAATISFAGTAFSVSLLVLQLGSSQYSPRIVSTLFRDPFNRRIVALVMGTFTYCLVVMRSVDSPLENEEAAVVPNISVVVAFILGLMSLLAIVAFIDHSANKMDISQLLETVARDTMVHIRMTWPEEDINDDSDNEEDEMESEKAPEYKDVEVKLKPKPNVVAEMEKVAYTFDTTTEASDISNDDPKKGYPSNFTPAGTSKMGEKAKILDASERNEEDNKNSEEKMDDCYVVRFSASGWVQEIDFNMLLKLVPPNGYIKLHTLAGRYASPGSAVCSVFPKPQNMDCNDLKSRFGIKVDKLRESVPSDTNLRRSKTGDEFDDEEDMLLEEFDFKVLDTVMIGPNRTIRSDATYGLRQLVDVILRALSPGVNDPTTAQDGIFHVAAVVTEFLQRVPPDSVLETDDGGKLYCTERHNYDRIVRLGFEEARICAASSPMVALYILEALRLIRESLQAAGHPHRAPEIERQARLTEENIRNASHIKEDYEFIVKARRDRFNTDVHMESLGIRGQLVV